MSRHICAPKDAKKAIREALREGFTIVHGGRHAKLRAPSGYMIPIPGTTSDVNCAKNVIKQIATFRSGGRPFRRGRA